MNNSNLDQDGGSEARTFGTSNGDGGRQIAQHQAAQAAQDAAADALARKVAGSASGAVPGTIKGA